MKDTAKLSELASKYYSNNNLYGTHSPISQTRIKKLLKIINKINCSDILDLGCGDGFFSKILFNVKPSCKIIGVDVSKKAVDIAKKRNLKVLRHDLNKRLEFNSEQFDLVHAGEIIEHITNTDLLINEIYRVLRTNGYLIISTPNLACWINRIVLSLGIQPIFSEVSYQKNFGRRLKILGTNSHPVGHIRVFTFSAMKEMLSYYGFITEKSYGCDVILNPFFKYLDKFFNLIPSLSSDLIFVARKVSRDM